MKATNVVKCTRQTRRLLPVAALATLIAFGWSGESVAAHKSRAAESSRQRSTQRGMERSRNESRSESKGRSSARSEGRSSSRRESQASNSGGRQYESRSRSGGTKYESRSDSSRRPQKWSSDKKYTKRYRRVNDWTSRAERRYRDHHGYRGSSRSYVNCPVVRWYDRPYYRHAVHGVYFPRFWLDVSIGCEPPPGYIFYDPYCNETFTTIAVYHDHVHNHHHGPVLDVVYIDDVECDPWWNISFSFLF